MKKTVLSVIIPAMLGCSASTFAASNGEGQINFTGEILDSACEVVNDLENPLSVDLGKISKTIFTGVGSTATVTSFNVQLKDCPETVTSAAIKFGGTADSDNSGVLALSTGTGIATGVGIQLVDASEQPVDLYTQTADYPLTSGSTTNNLTFGARYIQTKSAVTGGKANSASTFTVIYN